MGQGQTVTLSRINIPRRRDDIVTRGRLTVLLNEAIEKRLVIISAPAGYGKTSLVVDYAVSSPLPICWYSIDKIDNDPQRFLAYITAAIQQKFPIFGQSTQAILSGVQGHFDMELCTNVFINDLTDNVSEHFVLVLDDYHLVNDNVYIRSFMNKFIKDVDENIHIMILSRSLISIPILPLMVAKAEVAGISFAELAFQNDEIKELFDQTHDKLLSDTEAKEIYQQTEGWVTGIILTSQLSLDQSSFTRLVNVSRVGVDTFFLHLIDSLDAELRSFLLWSSLVEEFNPDICEKVIGEALLIDHIPWQRWMHSIQQDNLFVLQVGKNGEWMRYHPLFLEFLQSIAYRDFPVESAKIELNLARYCISQFEFERAYSIYENNKDINNIVSLLEHAGTQMLFDGKISIISSWINGLPQETISKHPFVINLQAYISMILGDKEFAMTLYDQSIAALRREGNIEFLARALSMRANNHRLIGNLDIAIQDSEESYQLLENNLLLRNIQGDSMRCKGLCYFHQGKLFDALNWLQKAQKVMLSAKDSKNEAVVQMEIGLVYENLGEYILAKEWYQKALKYWMKVNNPFWLANILNNLGVLYQLLGEYEKAISSFEEALAYAHSTGYTRMEAFIYTGISDVYVELQAYEQAQVGYERANKLAIYAKEHFLQVYILVQEASLSGLLGKTEMGYRFIEQARDLIFPSGSEMESKLCDLEYGRLKIVDGEVEENIELLEKTLVYFKAEGHKLQAEKNHLYLFFAYINNNNIEKIIEHLLQVISSLDAGWPSANLISICAKYQEVFCNCSVESLHDQLESINRRIKDYNENLPVIRKYLRENSITIPFAPPKLYIRSLGKMLVKTANHVISNQEWQTQAAKILFFTLLAHPEGITKEEICLIFWPDASQEDAKFRFKNTVYRLRRAVGKDCILFDQDYYRFNHKQDYAYDIEIFLKNIALSTGEKNIERKTEYLKNAIEQYGGKYLPEIEDYWVYSLRQAFQQNYISSLHQLSEIYLNMRDYKLSMDYCQKAINEDNLLEDSYRLAFRIYAAMGNKAGLIKQYKNCVDILDREIQTPPSNLTQSLYKDLLSGQ